MPEISFTTHLQRHLECGILEAKGETVREALESVFQSHPDMRSYLLDDQGAVRQHVMIFHNNKPIADRQTLSDPVQPHSKLYIMQALSGG